MYKRSWDVVQEDEGGGLQAAVDSLIARGRRKR
jgi:transcription initiation factor TFIIH subunit 2